LERIRRNLTDLIRAGEWWEYKLAPILAAFYATALTLQVPVSSLWLSALTLLLALVPGAAYVSVINDLTDRDEDLAAGKPNRLLGRSRLYAATLVALTAGAGVVFCILWRNDALMLGVYLAAWLAFSLYSLPPFRFKARGILGVLCDAGGAHLFPTLVAVILACRGAGRPVSIAWLAAVGTWAFAIGLRGILWHQLTDRDNDRLAGVRTFAQLHPPHVAARLGTYVVFPLELAALAAMLWHLRSVWAVGFLVVYALFAATRTYRFRLNPVIVAPKQRFLIVLNEYYDLFLPVAILLQSRDWIVLAIHLALFPNRWLHPAGSAVQLWRERRRPRHELE
jgi:4-hydroxybenzoate polyprenyltransferase